MSLQPRAMRGCVVGAGPSGLYVAQKLAEQGVPVSVFEESREILGNYKYARTRGTHFQDIPDAQGVELHLNTKDSEIDDCKCSFYVVATGGRPKAPSIPGAELCTPAMDVVKKYYDGKLGFLGDKICIIGMGNVTLDVLNYIRDKCRAVLVLSPRGASQAPFDNHLLRELIEGGSWSMSMLGNDAAATEESRNIGNAPHTNEYDASSGDDDRGQLIKRRNARRQALLKRISKTADGNDGGSPQPARPSLILHFGAKAEGVRPLEQQLEVTYSAGGKLFKEIFDRVISSVGFVPNRPHLDTSKPIFYTGWCVDARGNIDDARTSAELCVQDIIRGQISRPQKPL